MKLALCFTVISLFIGCKRTSWGKETQKERIINDYLTISIKGKLLEDDILEVYFAENIQDPYSLDNKQSIEVSGSDDIQDMVFRLPNRVYPMKLRIDLGSKGSETPFEIVEIKLSTGGKNKTFEIEEIKKVFRTNQYTEIELGSNLFLRKKVNGVYDPFILSGDLTKIVVDLFSED